MKLLKTGSL